MSHVLIVEDQAPLVRLLHSWVEAEGEHAITATSAEQALLLASARPPAVALCDVNLPGGRDGFWLAERLRELHPETAVVMTTGVNRIEAAVAGMRAGVVDYVVKPFTRARLIEALQRALSEHQSRLATGDDAAGASGVRGCALHATAALLTVLHAQGGTGFERAQRVAHLAAQLAAALGLAEGEVSSIEHAALLCHIERLDVHVLTRRVPLLGPANAIAVAAQERFDGTGFPLGLRGDAIPVGARILAVAMAYEDVLAASAIRPMTPAEAIATLCDARVREFDPAVLGALQLRLRPPVSALSA